jgi:hypothetical protein
MKRIAPASVIAAAILGGLECLDPGAIAGY